MTQQTQKEFMEFYEALEDFFEWVGENEVSGQNVSINVSIPENTE